MDKHILLPPDRPEPSNRAMLKLEEVDDDTGRLSLRRGYPQRLGEGMPAS